MSTPKFYFFDVGVANTLLRRGRIVPGSEAFGRALEHLVFLELRAWLDYSRSDTPLAYWRSRTGIEVDFVLGDHVAIEVKGTGRVTRRDHKGLRALAEDLPLARQIVVSTEPRRLRDEDAEIMPVEDFLDALWAGSIL